MSTYVYAITRPTTPPPESSGFGGAVVRMVTCDDVGAVVQDVDADPFRATTAALKEHARVLDALAAEHTVLPLQFGTVVRDDDAVADHLLRPHHDRLVELLDRLDGHVQLSLKVFNDEESTLRDVVSSDPRVARLSKKVKGVDPAAAYYDRIQLGQEVSRAIKERKAGLVEPLMAALSPLSTDTVNKEPSQDLMVFDADFLVPRERLAEFDAGVDELARARPELEFRYLGPMPAYAFADLSLDGG